MTSPPTSDGEKKIRDRPLVPRGSILFNSSRRYRVAYLLIRATRLCMVAGAVHHKLAPSYIWEGTSTLANLVVHKHSSSALIVSFAQVCSARNCARFVMNARRMLTAIHSPNYIPRPNVPLSLITSAKYDSVYPSVTG